MLYKEIIVTLSEMTKKLFYWIFIEDSTSWNGTRDRLRALLISTCVLTAVIWGVIDFFLWVLFEQLLG